MDFKKFDPKFSNQLELEGPEFSKMQAKQEAYIASFDGVWSPSPSIPLDIKGLTHKSGAIPATRHWWRKTSSFERNGNIRAGQLIFFFNRAFLLLC